MIDTKCKGLRLTFPASYSTTLSTRRKGYRCGKILLISSKEKTVLTSLVNADIASAPTPVATLPAISALILEGSARWDGRLNCGVNPRTDEARRDARKAVMESFMVMVSLVEVLRSVLIFLTRNNGN